MDKEPKESVLPIAIAGGAMLVCCLGSLLLVSGGSGLVAWLGGFDPLLAVGVAVAICAVIVVFRRMRKSSTLTKTERTPTSAFKGDQ
jgi:hypothetical protein